MRGLMSDNGMFMGDDDIDHMGNVQSNMEDVDGTTMSSNDDMRASMNNMESMNMETTFFTGKDFYLLFNCFHIVSDTDYILAILCTAVFGFFGTCVIHTCKHVEHQAMAEHSVWWNVAGVLATTTRLVLHYMAMLLAMTYEVGIFVAICVGGGLGFLFIKGCHNECLKRDAVKKIKAEKNELRNRELVAVGSLPAY